MIDKLQGRNKEIKAAIEKREILKVQETLIMQKVNKAHREAFKERFPGQIEHCMRLTAERLQGLLTTKPEDIANTLTWAGSPQELNELTQALYHLSIMNQHYPVEE